MKQTVIFTLVLWLGCLTVMAMPPAPGDRQQTINGDTVYVRAVISKLYREMTVQQIDGAGNVLESSTIRLSGVSDPALRAEAVFLSNGAVALIMIYQDSRLASQEFVGRIDIFDAQSSRHMLSIDPWGRDGLLRLLAPSDVTSVGARIALRLKDGKTLLVNPVVSAAVVESGYRNRIVQDWYGENFYQGFLRLEAQQDSATGACLAQPSHKLEKCRKSASKQFKKDLKKLASRLKKKGDPGAGRYLDNQFIPAIEDLYDRDKMFGAALPRDPKSYLVLLDGTLAVGFGPYNDPNYSRTLIDWNLETNPFLEITGSP